MLGMGKVVDEYLITPAEKAITRLAENEVKRIIDEKVLGELGHLMFVTVGLAGAVFIVSLVFGYFGLVRTERFLNGVLILIVMGYSTVTFLTLIYHLIPPCIILVKSKISPRQFARAMAFILTLREYEAYRKEYPEKFGIGEAIAYFAGRQVEPESVCLKIVSHLMPILERHLIKRLLEVITPIVSAYIYLRYFVLPTMTHLDGHLVMLQAALYPIAVIWQALSGQ